MIPLWQSHSSNAADNKLFNHVRNNDYVFTSCIQSAVHLFVYTPTWKKIHYQFPNEILLKIQDKIRYAMSDNVRMIPNLNIDSTVKWSLLEIC